MTRVIRSRSWSRLQVLLGSAALMVITGASVATAQVESSPDRSCYFGDTHAHSTLSSDAFGFGNRLSPENAYRFARGEAVYHVIPGSEKVQLHSPLDFFMMTDHSEMMGIASQSLDSTSAVYNSELGKLLRANDPDSGAKALFQLQNAVGSGVLPEGYTFDAFRDVWQQVIADAEKYNEPGKFTTFVAYEWTSMPDGENLHRNVIFRGTDVPGLPFTAMDSTVPEDLWTFLEYQREQGSDNLAISHNGNLSNGRMFRLVDSYGAPITAEYARRRNENEPLHEAMQLKGTSMTHPAFSPDDEWADFELLPVSLHTWQPTQQGAVARFNLGASVAAFPAPPSRHHDVGLWPAELGHPIEDVTSDHGLSRLRAAVPRLQAASEH